MTLKYAGIGARATPESVLKVMTLLAKHYAMAGTLLRSGGAAGADRAYELGAGDLKEIYTVNDVTEAALATVDIYHPNPSALKPYVRKLHARNALIILGPNLDDPVDYVSCWTPNGAIVGGTGQALRIAEDFKIPIYNLFE